FMPFITEEIWQKLSEATKSQGQCEAKRSLPGRDKVTSIMVEPWPHLQENIIDKKSERAMEQAIELITTIRNIRSELEIGTNEQIALKICAANKARRSALEDHLENIRHLARAGEITFSEKYAHQPGNFVTVLKDLHLVIPLAGVIDIDKYKRKLDSRIDGAQAELKAKEKMLANKSFIERAPAEIVEKERVRLKEITETLGKLKGVKDGIS
ncbi:MAG: class I tRNA ligase family protein, partial [Candidatus Omnitrophica bacterium]|nr:class I tRNA ligase family protein [Candidatus Omnitrophota bacterium]